MNTVKQILTTKEIRRKMEWMIFIIFIVRFISMIPVPGIDSSVFQQWMASQSNDALNLLSAFTGGSFERFSIFAIGITPLITAQIIVQLLMSVITPLSKLHKKGEHGQKIIKRITNISAIALAAIQSCFMAIGLGKSGMITHNGIWSIVLVTVCMTIGTAIMIWFSEILTKKSIGNGVSILLMVNIISRMPMDFVELFNDITSGKTKMVSVCSVLATIAIVMIIIIVVIYMTEGYHPLHVQYSQKMSHSGKVLRLDKFQLKLAFQELCLSFLLLL